MRGRVGSVVLALVLSAGCDGGEAEDAGPVILDAGSVGPTPPDIPWLMAGAPPIEEPLPPALTPCPTGWREVEPTIEGAPPTCDPFPEGGASTCAEGEAHFPGETDCAPVGAACPPGEFAEGLADDGSVLFVRPGASGGDGSRALPFGSVEAAMAVAAEGMTVALAAGRYTAPVTMAAGVTLRGTCARDTVLGATSGSATLTAAVAGARLRDLRVEGGGRPGIFVTGPGSSLDARGVVVTGVTAMGIYVAQGATVTGDELVITDTSPAPDGRFGRGMGIERASAEVSRALIERSHDLAIFVAGAGSALTLRDAVVRDTSSRAADGLGGRGLALQDGAAATLERVLFERNRDYAIFAASGVTLNATDAVVRDTLGRERDGAFGHALGLSDGSMATVTRWLVERSATTGLELRGEGTSLTSMDAVIRDTEAQASDGSYGRGVSVAEGASLELARAWISGHRDLAVFAHGVGTVLTMRDVEVRDTRSEDATGRRGTGIGVSEGASADLSRARVRDSHGDGVHVVGSGASLSMRDTIVSGTRGRASDGARGAGLSVELDATADVSHVVIEGNSLAGVAATGEGVELTLTDAVIRDTRGRDSDGLIGRGLSAQLGATVRATRILLERNRESSVAAIEVGTEVLLEDAVVRDTLPAACESSGCAGRSGGHGVASVSNADIRVTRFTLSRSALCGLFVARDATLSLQTGRVTDNPIGACLQVAGFDVARLTDDVLYQNNPTTFEATDLPVPDPASASGPAQL